MEALINYLTASPETQYFFVMSSVLAGLALFLSGFYFSFVRPMGHYKMNKRLGNSGKRLVDARLFKTQDESPASPLLFILKAVLGWAKVGNLQRTLYQADIFYPPEAFLSVTGILACAGYLAGSLFETFYWLTSTCGSKGTVSPPAWRGRCREAWTCYPALCGPATPSSLPWKWRALRLALLWEWK